MLASLLALLAGSGAALAAPGPAGDLQALVEELMPFVEEAAGRPFLEVPEVVVAEPVLLAEVLYREQLHLLGKLSELPEAQAREAALHTAGDLSGAFVGKYGFLDKKLYVAEGGIHHALASRGVHPAQVGPVLEVVLAHELAHALQDQHTDLGDVVSNRPDGDAVMAVNCVVEGHAVWVHEQVGQARGHPLAVGLVADIHGYDPDLPGLARDADHFYTSYVYGQGRAFVDWHARHGGADAVWTLLVEPPATSAMIMDPSTYAPAAEPDWPEPVRAALQRARRQLSRRGWSATEERVGDYDLREHLVDRCRDHRLADSLQAGWRSRATGGSAMLGVELQLLGFDSPQAARAYVDRMRFNAERQLDALLPPVASAMTPGISGSVTSFDALASDVSAREAIVLEVGGERQELSTLWIARGPNVIQVVTVNHPVSDRKLARKLDRVFRTLE